MFLEELLLSFTLEFILFEELLEQGMRVIFFSSLVFHSLNRGLNKSDSISGSEHSSEGEESVLNVKERSEEVSVHVIA